MTLTFCQKWLMAYYNLTYLSVFDWHVGWRTGDVAENVWDGWYVYVRMCEHFKSALHCGRLQPAILGQLVVSLCWHVSQRGGRCVTHGLLFMPFMAAECSQEHYGSQTEEIDWWHIVHVDHSFSFNGGVWTTIRHTDWNSAFFHTKVMNNMSLMRRMTGVLLLGVCVCFKEKIGDWKSH